MNNQPLEQSRRQLRRELRALRCALPARQQREAAQGVARQLALTLSVLRARRIACYLAADGEISPEFFCQRAWHSGKQLYLPRLYADGSNRVHFLRYCADTALEPNRFAILEPVRSQPILPARCLQVVLMPLVGFDATGNRLGMGGGFYDRSFAFKRIQPQQRPLLIGLAHSFQQLPQLPVASWDTPVDMVVTERAVFDFRPGYRREIIDKRD